jgi:dipeptidase D
MVCIGEDDASDPARGVIHLAREGEWIRAVGSTLGADNGIAIAAMQALAETTDLPHGPLELIFTAQEETTSAGADALDPAWVRSKTLLNLDSEEDGVLVIGSAGGIWSSMKWTAPMPGVPEGHVALEISLSGLLGGHSGSDISLHRLNAIEGLLYLLRAAASEAPIFLSAIEGGDAFSAIPRTSRAVIAVEGPSSARVQAALARAKDDLVDEYRPYEPDLTVRVRVAGDLPARGYSPPDSRRLVDLLSVIPCGVLALDPRLPGLVETSSSLGVIARAAGDLVIQNFTRSSVMSAMRAVVDGLRAAARLAGAEFSVIPPEGPSWEADPDSQALVLARATYRRLFGQDPQVLTVHGFLECSLIKKQIPDLDIVSFGPEIRDAHRPGERVNIGSVNRFYRLLTEVVAAFALEGRT